MKKQLYFTLIFLMALCIGYSQEDASASKNKIPSLNGHNFTSINYLRSSFITTSLQANLGIGITSNIKIPGIIIDDYEILSFEGKILYLNMEVQYHQRFTPWLEMFMSFGLAGRLGTDMSTILADGVNTISGGNIGWMIRISQSKKFNLSGSVYVQNLTGNFINVTEYFKEIINNNPDPSVTKIVPAMMVGGGIMGAYAFSPTFGLQFQSDILYGESFERGKTKVYWGAAIVGDADFNPKYNVPVGLAFGYTLTSAPEIVMNDGGFSNLLTGKVSYTGSKEFELGLQYNYYNVTIKSVDEKPFLSKITLILKFYF